MKTRISSPQLLKCTRLVLGLFILLLFIPAQGSEKQADLDYQSAIKQARLGDYNPALTLLKKLVAEKPSITKYQYDYVTILGWAEKDKTVFSQLKKFPLDTTPAYVLAILAKSARNTKHFNEAIAIYKAAIKQNTEREEYHIGLALSLADAQRGDEALKTIKQLRAIMPKNINVLKAEAYIYESIQDFVNALSIHDSILLLEPSSKHALRGRILNISRLGAVQLASSLADKHPEVLSSKDFSIIKNDEAALLIRWGRLPTAEPNNRYEITDQAIQLLINLLKNTPKNNSNATNRINFDLMVAYRDRRMMKESIDIYKKLKIKNVKFPAYVLHAIGEAYLHLKQPKKALPILQESLQLQPKNIATEISLFYSYLDDSQYKKALSFINETAKNKKNWLKLPGVRKKTWNPEKMQIDVVASLAHAFVGNLPEGQKRLRRLREAAPGNLEIRNELAHVYLWRGWPRLALSEFAAIKTLDENHFGSTIGSAEAAMTVGDYSRAKEILTPLRKIYEDEPGFIRASNDLITQEMREISIYSNGGSDSLNYGGNNNYQLDAYYFSYRIKHHWRPYVRALYQQSEFATETMSYKRYGIGLDYKAKSLSGLFELHANDSLNKGVLLKGSWQVDDFWSLSSSFDSNSDDTPLRARIKSINATETAFNLNYRMSERRAFSFGLGYYNFNDGNNRYSLYASALQQLVTIPKYSLSARLFIYQQRNNNINAPYFNPDRMTSSEITFINNWKTYQHYERRFQQRLSPTIGLTHQRGFSAGLTWNLAYQHSWDIDNRLAFSYGIKYGKSRYDGKNETTSSGFLSLNKRF